jgi:biotin-dependent carboxylase-like uncharacterized protein
MIEILSNAALATIQDGGRLGHYRDGVGRSGAMDGVALALGNALLGNDRNAAAIEIPILPFSVRFAADLDIAVTGADCDARLGETALPPDWAIRARAGEVLTLRAPLSGCRAYLCVGGGIDVPEVLGSRSTQLRERFGGLEGRMLQKGDRLRALRTETVLPEGGLGAVRPQPLPGDGSGTVVRVLPAAEYNLFLPEARRSLWEAEWTVTPQSNRAGYRLSGPELQLTAPVEMRSHGVVPGVIQVPPGGQPIIQLADAATMGGYPKIGAVIEADLWRLAQVRPGEHIRFLETDYQGAVAALNELEAVLADAEAMARRVRGAIRGWTG